MSGTLNHRLSVCSIAYTSPRTLCMNTRPLLLLRSGTEVLSSPLTATWLRRLYPPRPRGSAKGGTTRDADSDSDDSDDSSEDRSEDGSEGRGESREEKPTQADSAVKQESRWDENPFIARIVAHRGCVKELWRARYLAMREVLLLVPVESCRRWHNSALFTVHSGMSHG